MLVRGAQHHFAQNSSLETRQHTWYSWAIWLSHSFCYHLTPDKFQISWVMLNYSAHKTRLELEFCPTLLDKKVWTSPKRNMKLHQCWSQVIGQSHRGYLVTTTDNILHYNLSPCNPLTAWHGVQQDDVIQLAEVRFLRAASKVSELHPWWWRGKEDHGGV